MEKNVCLPRDIGFLLLPGFSMLALFSMLDPLRLANRLLGSRYYTWRVFTSDGLPVKASCGMSISADSKAASTGKDNPACLIVIAGFDPWPPPNQHLKTWLWTLNRNGATLGSIDTGAFLLASADLLKDVPVVVHWESAGPFLELFSELSLSENLFEIQDRRILCAGGTAVLEMMITLLERNHGAALAAGVADRVMHEVRGGRKSKRVFPASSDPMPVSDPDVLKAIEIMQSRIETVSSISEIADATNISKRSLERKFRQFVNLTPAQAYLQLRLEYAQQLLQNTDLKIREISLASGFGSMSYFCRAYKSLYHRQPGRDRHLDYSLVESRTVLSSGTQRTEDHNTPPASTKG